MFAFLKKKTPKFSVEMSAYENGKRVELESIKESVETGESWDLSISPTLNRVIKPMENRMVEYATIAKNSKRVRERKTALEGVIKTYYAIKSKCASLGPEYTKYFSQMWENLHNSRTPCFSYVEKFEKELIELNENFSELSSQEVQHDCESINLEDRVLKVLKSNQTMLQTDIYKKFDKIVQKDIQSILYFMERNGHIKREKTGRTYTIRYIK